MNTRALVLAFSFAAATIGGVSVARCESSLGTSKLRTPGGTNALKFSVVNANNIQAAREIAYSINANNLRSLLSGGYKVSMPAMMANETQIRPWKAGEKPVLSKRTGEAISARLTKLIAKAQQLHDKLEITDTELRNVQSLQGVANTFSANAALLAKYKVAVLLDE